MANSRVGNKLYIDTGSDQVTTKRTVVVGIFFTPNAVEDSVILQDTASLAAPLKIQGATAKDTKYFDLVNSPVIFENGIYVASISASAVATLIVKG